MPTKKKKAPAKKAPAKKAPAKKAQALRAGIKFFWGKTGKHAMKDLDMAKTIFDLHVKKGLKPFHLDKKGNKGKEMREFTPCAGGALFLSITRYDRITTR
jgi:hypothetical protein